MNLIQSFRLFLLVLILVGLGLIFAQALWVPTVVDNILAYTDQAILAPYHCDGGRTIDANYYAGVVALRLSDGRALTLAQTISASGARYADPEETFVFWSKGDGALVLENGVEKGYRGCVVAK